MPHRNYSRELIYLRLRESSGSFLIIRSDADCSPPWSIHGAEAADGLLDVLRVGFHASLADAQLSRRVQSEQLTVARTVTCCSTCKKNNHLFITIMLTPCILKTNYSFVNKCDVTTPECAARQFLRCVGRQEGNSEYSCNRRWSCHVEYQLSIP